MVTFCYFFMSESFLAGFSWIAHLFKILQYDGTAEIVMQCIKNYQTNDQTVEAFEFIKSLLRWMMQECGDWNDSNDGKDIVCPEVAYPAFQFLEFFISNGLTIHQAVRRAQFFFQHQNKRMQIKITRLIAAVLIVLQEKLESNDLISLERRI